VGVEITVALLGYRLPLPMLYEERAEPIQIAIVGIDLGKNVCSLTGLEGSGQAIVRRRVRLGPGPINRIPKRRIS
jgi:hypothetical protein